MKVDHVSKKMNTKNIECMRFFFTVTVTLNLSVIFVTLIFVYAVNYRLIKYSLDSHVWTFIR